MNILRRLNVDVYGKYPYLIGRDKKVIRVHIVKTAGTSLQKSLRFNVPNKKIGIRKHYFVREIIKIEGEQVWQDAFTFSFVRNPWDRVYSMYRYRLRKGKVPSHIIDFKSWVMQTLEELKFNPYHHLQSHCQWLMDYKGEINLDFIGRFENLSEDISRLSTLIEKPIKMVHVNQNLPIIHYSEVYDQELIDVIAKVYKDDIDFFGYDYEEK